MAAGERFLGDDGHGRKLFWRLWEFCRSWWWSRDVAASLEGKNIARV